MNVIFKASGNNTMRKTILITGATDGIGLETPKMLVSQGPQGLAARTQPGETGKNGLGHA